MRSRADPHRAHRFARIRSPGKDRGAATAEFTMVSALLVLLSFAILQLTLMVHVRNTLIDAASTGARFGVLEDRTAGDGVQRTRTLIESSISSRYAQDVGYEYLAQPEGQTLQITVQAQVPVLGLFPGVGSLEVTGSAYDFD
ncbi:TadE/TadG family type IV pilus assembly protein [Nesterenkonia sp. YGD6]|uniref:TadE/TadG family type IV pilus assembly protein n=1 Tax=Nesterenkonia sp. YGD6 TaxID=2901231 RepID=UPI003144DF39